MNKFKVTYLLLILLGFSKFMVAMQKYSGFIHLYKIAEQDGIMLEGNLPLKVQALIKAAKFNGCPSTDAHVLALAEENGDTKSREYIIALAHLRDLTLHELPYARPRSRFDQVLAAVPSCFHHDLIKDAIENEMLKGFERKEVLSLVEKYANNDSTLKTTVMATKFSEDFKSDSEGYDSE